MTYLATASICESDDSCFWNPFFFSIAFFQLENPFRKRWVCSRWSYYSALRCFQASMRTSCISSLVMMQPLKSSNHAVEMIFLLDSYSRRSLKFFGWYGLSDMFTKTWSGGLSSVFVVSSLSAIVVDGSKSFSFSRCSLIRISSTTPRSVSLMHGLTHDKTVPYLFSTPQARSQRQTEILIHLLKKINKSNGPSKWHQRRVVFSRPYMWILSMNMERTSMVAAHAPTKYQSNTTSGRGARASYRTMLPEISAWR